MGQKGCLNWARDLFHELGSWQDESQKLFSNIIASHNTNIINGISNLLSEVHGLQSELKITRKERTNLMETVKNLNDEIGMLKSELTILQPLSQPEDHDQDTDAEYTVAQEQDEEGLGIGNKTGEDPLTYENRSDVSTDYEISDDDDDANDYFIEEENEYKTDWAEEEKQLVTVKSEEEEGITDETSNISTGLFSQCKFEFSTPNPKNPKSKRKAGMASLSPSTPKRIDLSIEEKREIISKYDNLPKMSTDSAARMLKIPRSTLRCILSKREAIMTAPKGEIKRNRVGKYPIVEDALMKWFDTVTETNANITKRFAPAPPAGKREQTLLGSSGFLIRIRSGQH